MIRTGNTENVLGHLAQADPLRLQYIANAHWDGTPFRIAYADLGRLTNLNPRLQCSRESWVLCQLFAFTNQSVQRFKT
jgi:hypothetical protein